MLNNNVVLARDEIGREAILTGRGLGFQRKRGQDVDASLISRRYIPAERFLRWWVMANRWDSSRRCWSR